MDLFKKAEQMAPKNTKKTATPKASKVLPKNVRKAPKAHTERPVIVCTEMRGVFFGYATDTRGEQVSLRNARCAIYFGTKRGVLELAETGPTASSKIGARADIDLRKVSAVFEVTPAARDAWEHA